MRLAKPLLICVAYSKVKHSNQGAKPLQGFEPQEADFKKDILGKFSNQFWLELHTSMALPPAMPGPHARSRKMKSTFRKAPRDGGSGGNTPAAARQRGGGDDGRDGGGRSVSIVSSRLVVAIIIIVSSSSSSRASSAWCGTRRHPIDPCRGTGTT